MANTIRIKRGLKANLPALLAGELGYCNDTQELFVGRVNPGNGFTENSLVNDLSDLANYYTKTEVEALAGLGIAWNSGEEQFDVIIATKIEAEAGEVDSKLMTPERTAEAISFQTSGLLTSQGYFSTSDIATQGEAQAGSVNNKLMTPLRTKEAIEALSSVVTISTTAPSDPKNGDLWWDNEEGILYIYTSAVWVEVSFGEETVTKDQVLTLTNTVSYTPTQNFHPATKTYVDQLAQGIKARTSALVYVEDNLAASYDDQPLLHELTASVNGAFPTTDGVDSSVLNVVDVRILVAGQTNAEENGLYVVKEIGDASNPWVLRRCTQCDTAAKIPGSYIFITDGTIYGNTGWILDVDDPTTFVLGTDDINAIQFAGVGTFGAGTGLELVGTVFNLASEYGDDLNPYGDKIANRVLAGPTTGSENVPTFRELVADDIPDIGISKVTNLQTGLDAKANNTLTLLEKTANYTLVGTDAGKVLIFDSASDLTLTIPLNSSVAFPVGTQIAVLRNGTGTLTFAGVSGVDVFSVESNLSISDQYGSAVLLQIKLDEWQLIGSLL